MPLSTLLIMKNSRSPLHFFMCSLNMLL